MAIDGLEPVNHQAQDQNLAVRFTLKAIAQQHRIRSRQRTNVSKICGSGSNKGSGGNLPDKEAKSLCTSKPISSCDKTVIHVYLIDYLPICCCHHEWNDVFVCTVFIENSRTGC